MYFENFEGAIYERRLEATSSPGQYSSTDYSFSAGPNSSGNASVRITMTAGRNGQANVWEGKDREFLVVGSYDTFATDNVNHPGRTQPSSAMLSITPTTNNCLRQVTWGSNSGVKDLSYAFNNQTVLASVGQPPATVTNMQNMFSNSRFNSNISGWNVTNVTNWTNFRLNSSLTLANTPAKFR